MKLLIKFPTRERPLRFAVALQRYVDFARTDPFFLINVDSDDSTMNRARVDEVLSSDRFMYHVAAPGGKVNAINRGMEWVKDWDVLLLASDDMMPRIPGYDEIILSDMAKYYPDKDGVLHYNDGYMGSKLNTLVVMGRKYYDRFGYIYHPDYASLFCDNEFMEVASLLGRQTYIDKVIIRHEHPFTGGVAMDGLYKKNNALFKVDQAVYNSRKLFSFEVDKYKNII